MAGRKKTVSLPPKKPSPVTKDELAKAIAPLATKDELAKAIAPLATKAELDEAIAKAIAPLATKAELDEAIAKAIAPLATKAELDEAIAPLATKADKSDLEAWGTRLYDVIEERIARLALDLRRELRLDMDEAFRGFRQEMQQDMAQIARSLGEELRAHFGVVDDKYDAITRDLDVRVAVLERAK